MAHRTNIPQSAGVTLNLDYILFHQGYILKHGSVSTKLNKRRHILFHSNAFKSSIQLTFIEQVNVLREAVELAKQHQPFEIIAWIVLSNHLHTVRWLGTHMAKAALGTYH